MVDAKHESIDGLQTQYDLKGNIVAMESQNVLLAYIKELLQRLDPHNQSIYNEFTILEFKLLVSTTESVDQVPHMDGFVDSSTSTTLTNTRFSILIPLRDTVSPVICGLPYDELPVGEHFLDDTRAYVWDAEHYKTFDMQAGSLILFDSTVPHFGPGYDRYKDKYPCLGDKSTQRAMIFISLGLPSIEDNDEQNYEAAQTHAFEWARQVYVDHLQQPNMFVSFLFKHLNSNPLTFYTGQLGLNITNVIKDCYTKLLVDHEERFEQEVRNGKAETANTAGTVNPSHKIETTTPTPAEAVDTATSPSDATSLKGGKGKKKKRNTTRRNRY